jgi:hypothetical protein
MKTRREIYEAHYRCYQRAEKQEKGKIFDEVAGTTGLNRDHLAHVLSSYGKEQAGRVGGQTGAGEAQHRRRKREPGKRGGRPTTVNKLRATLSQQFDLWEVIHKV